MSWGDNVGPGGFVAPLSGRWRGLDRRPGVTLRFTPGYLRRLFQSRLSSAAPSEPGCGVIRPKYKQVSAYGA